MNLKLFLQDCQERVDAALDQYLKPEKFAEAQLGEAIRYGVFNGGKRVRPVLVYATAKAVGVPIEDCDNAACAVELIHAYSLIHDDLPAMDNDDLRRGKPTCHIAFDEATAILAGDAMQALAFEVLLQENRTFDSPQQLLNMARLLAHASGAEGMAGGQAMDLNSTGEMLSLTALENMHQLKTGALIRASVLIGASGAKTLEAESVTCLEQYAKAVGLAFQIRDDILDVESDTLTLGKPQGSDAQLNKATYTSVLGLEQAKRLAEDQHRQALSALERFDDDASMLRELSAFIVNRSN